MRKRSLHQTLANFRSRLTERVMARFEVIGRHGDRELIRSVARRLAEGGADADRLRAALNQAISDESPGKGAILKGTPGFAPHQFQTRPEPSA